MVATITFIVTLVIEIHRLIMGRATDIYFLKRMKSLSFIIYQINFIVLYYNVELLTYTRIPCDLRF